ncbi:hypothetical protein CHARACLAT_005431 [Characodon lateralis]|uniref:Secreted protein n=1 Tax=Characodon lateralis TaxID=208331 RepID=A0ABU7CVQ7_9TELE|nr:hypothetical protein [Characodon lateralis]
MWPCCWASQVFLFLHRFISSLGLHWFSSPAFFRARCVLTVYGCELEQISTSSMCFVLPPVTQCVAKRIGSKMTPSFVVLDGTEERSVVDMFHRVL